MLDPEVVITTTKVSNNVTGEIEAKQEVKRLRMENAQLREENSHLKKLLDGFDHRQKKTTHHQPKPASVPQNDPRAKKKFLDLKPQQKRKVTSYLHDSIRRLAEERDCEPKHIIAFLLW